MIVDIANSEFRDAEEGKGRPDAVWKGLPDNPRIIQPQITPESFNELGKLLLAADLIGVLD